MNEVQQKVTSFFEKYPQRRFHQGQDLISANEDPQGIFYLESGFVCQTVTSLNGDQHILNIYKTQSFFPMFWAINQTANTYDFEAMSDVVVRVAPSEHVVTFIQGNPEVMYDLLSRLYKGLNGLLTRLEHALAGDATQKLVSILVITARRHGQEKDGWHYLTLPMTETELAEQAGISRETVSRIMQKLKKDALVTFAKGRLSSVDLVKLETVLATI